MDARKLDHPQVLPFRTMPPAQVASYMEAFRAAVPVLVDELEQAVSREESGWQADRSEASLDAIDRWLGRRCSMTFSLSRRLNGPAARAGRQPSGSGFGWELCDEAFVATVAIGMYLGETLIFANPSVRWKQILDVRDLYYGHPALEGLDVLDATPINTATLHAISAAKGDKRRSLRRTFSIWMHYRAP